MLGTGLDSGSFCECFLTFEEIPSTLQNYVVTVTFGVALWLQISWRFADEAKTVSAPPSTSLLSSEFVCRSVSQQKKKSGATGGNMVSYPTMAF